MSFGCWRTHVGVLHARTRVRVVEYTDSDAMRRIPHQEEQKRFPQTASPSPAPRANPSPFATRRSRKAQGRHCLSKTAFPLSCHLTMPPPFPPVWLQRRRPVGHGGGRAARRGGTTELAGGDRKLNREDKTHITVSRLCGHGRRHGTATVPRHRHGTPRHAPAIVLAFRQYLALPALPGRAPPNNSGLSHYVHQRTGGQTAPFPK